MRFLLLFGVFGACTSPVTDVATCPCDEISLPASPVTDDASVLSLLSATQVAAFPELNGVTLAVSPVEDLAFFRASIDLGTLSVDTTVGRVYRVEYDPIVLSDPPEPAALAAVLAHELGHVNDYAAMTSTEYLDFGLWYAEQSAAGSDDLAAYERATDEQALTRGCAAGLSAMREWIYAHCTGEVLAEKQRDYYSPDEIAAWVEAHGACEM